MASTTSNPLPIILYHYPYSPFAKRVVWYLQLRGIPYVQCLQPPILPRPDLARLDVNHRRIPILSIGRDIYLDSRLIISKLESLPHSTPKLSSTSPEHSAIEALLRTSVIDAGVFTSASFLLPSNLPLTKDPAFKKDRATFFTTKISASDIPIALSHIKSTFQLLETTLLADGRDWVLGTPSPSLSDIEAIWPLDWLVGLPGALPADQISPAIFPKVFAWIARFNKAVSTARKANKSVQSGKVTGEEAEGIIRNAELNDERVNVDETEPMAKFHGFKEGARSMVEVWPADTGSGYRDLGALVGLDEGEIVLEKENKGGKGAVRVHAPRHGFRIRGVVDNLKKEGGKL